MCRLSIGLLVVAMASPMFAREWTDATGAYSVEADLIARNDNAVVLKKPDHSLVSVPIAKLSARDQAFLKSQAANDQVRSNADQLQTWTMRSGLKVVGKVIEYGRREVTIQRRRGRIYVNDRVFDNLSPVQQRMLPKVVSHFEKLEIEGKEGLEDWILKLKGEPRHYTCEGVILELEDGDEYGVPFFFFSDEDLKVLQPGWDKWAAADKQKTDAQQQAFLLQAQAQAYQRDRQASQQIATMQLEMTAYQSGLFDMWEVYMAPRPGVASQPLCVVVPARDSRSAAEEAMRRNPNFVPGRVNKVTRKGY